MLIYEGRTCTGSAKRVGKVIALAFARKGYAVVVHYKTSKKDSFIKLQRLITIHGQSL